MFAASSNFLTKIKEASRTIQGYVVINASTIPEDFIIDFSVETQFGSGGLPAIGGVTSRKLTLKLIQDASIPTIVGQPIKPYVGIEISTGVYEYVPLGVFYASYSDIKKTERSIEIECFDKMAGYDNIVYSTSLTYPATHAAVRAEIASNFSVTFASQTLPSVNVEAPLTGTLRQVLGQLAALLTRNAIIDVSGNLSFIFFNSPTFTLSSDNYLDFRLDSEAMVDITHLIVEKENEEDNIVYGTSAGYAFKFANDSVLTYAQLQTIFNREFPLSYYAYTMRLQGMPHLEVGDVVQFTDKFNSVRNIAILSHKLTFNGGMMSEFRASAPSEPVANITPTGGSNLTQALKYAAPDVTAAITNATDLIRGAQGGSIITNLDVNGKPYELLVINTNDINTASKVWRWNINGLGYSNTGNSGTYTTAITADGAIVADFISTGTLNADRIRAGTLASFNGVSSINMANGQFSLASGAITFNGTTTNFTGQVTISGGSGIQNLSDAGSLASLDSIAYNSSYITGTKPPEDADRTITAINGGLITTGRIELGTTGTINAGIEGAGTAGTSIRFWAGNTYANRTTAPFRVDQAGNLTATSATISGNITMTGGSITWASVTAPSYSQITGTKPPTDAINAATATTITQNTVTTAYVNALSVTAGSVSADNITAGTITGSNIRTASTGKRIDIGYYTGGEVSVFSTGGIEGIIYGNTSTGMTISGSTKITLNSSSITTYGDVAPSTSGSYTCGSSTYRWNYVYGINGSFTGNFAANGQTYFIDAYSRVISTRAVYINSGGTLGTTASTIRVKENLMPYEFNLAALLELDVYSFNFKPEFSDDDSLQYGVIAEQADALGLHEFIGYDLDGLPDYFAYEKLPVALLQVCQKLNERIKSLEMILEG